MKLPKVTNKQKEILELLYRYRFLNRIQIQALLHHKDYKTINLWLKDLREKYYVAWIYSDHFLEKSKPAIYYLGTNGIRYLKTVTWDNEDGETLPYYPVTELHKRYKEADRTRTFVDRSVLLAQCCVEIEKVNASSDEQNKTSTANTSRIKYGYCTEADYLDSDHTHHFLATHEKLRPNLCIVKQKDTTTTHYLLEIFDPSLPQYRVRSKVKNYVTYLTEHEWEGEDPEPILLLVLPSLYGLIYAKRKVRKLLLDEYYEAADIPKGLHIRFATTEQLQTEGITANIWGEGRKRLGL